MRMKFTINRQLRLASLTGIILGNLTFIGISYRGHHHTRTLNQRFSALEAVMDLHQKAIELGIHEFAIQVPENEQMKIHWNVLSEINSMHENVSFIPNIGIPILLDGHLLDIYRRWTTVLSTYNNSTGKILDTVVNDRILQCRPDWKSMIVRAVNEKQDLSLEEVSRVKLDRKTIEQTIDQLSGFRVQFLEFGSEADFLAASGRIDLIGELIDLGKSFGYPVGFGVHHAALTLPKLGKIKDIQGILTPMNPIGMMMFPTQTKALQAIQKVQNRKQRLIGIKPFAGGHYPQVAQCLSFLSSQGIERFMAGISSSAELQQVVEEWNHLKKTPSSLL